MTIMKCPECGKFDVTFRIESIAHASVHPCGCYVSQDDAERTRIKREITEMDMQELNSRYNGMSFMDKRRYVPTRKQWNDVNLGRKGTYRSNKFFNRFGMRSVWWMKKTLENYMMRTPTKRLERNDG